MCVKYNSYNISDLQKKMLEIFKYFDELCQKNGFTYFAAYGTCIGAIRHKGFIPWDDDLDVYMPRCDYERLWNVWADISNNPKYILCRTRRDKNYHHRVMQVVDINTTFINSRCVNEDIEHGVYIDVMPLDGAAPRKLGRIVQAFNAIIYSVYNIQVEPEFHGNRFLSFGTRFLLKVIKNPDRRYRLWSKAELKMSKYETHSSGLYLDLNNYFKMIFKPMKTEWFVPVRVPFADTTICVPAGYDDYLGMVYGEYMILPPEEKRTPMHNTVKIDLENSYEKYKGQFYCVSSK